MARLSYLLDRNILSEPSRPSPNMSALKDAKALLEALSRSIGRGSGAR